MLKTRYPINHHKKTWRILKKSAVSKKQKTIKTISTKMSIYNKNPSQEMKIVRYKSKILIRTANNRKNRKKVNYQVSTTSLNITSSSINRRKNNKDAFPFLFRIWQDNLQLPNTIHLYIIVKSLKYLMEILIFLNNSG